MEKALIVDGRELAALTIPEDFKLIRTEQQRRNRETVRVDHYQNTDEIVPNHEHITVIYGADGRLISYNRSTASTQHQRVDNPVDLAFDVWQDVDDHYAGGLQYMRTDNLQRTYIDDRGKRQTLKINWVKFAHHNGSYNWVSIDENGQVIELERESFWDYFRSRRFTEEWNYDNWVLAREGKGPQLAAPEALA